MLPEPTDDDLEAIGRELSLALQVESIVAPGEAPASPAATERRLATLIWAVIVKRLAARDLLRKRDAS